MMEEELGRLLRGVAAGEYQLGLFENPGVGPIQTVFAL
jgi:hypothetical protein